MFIEHFDKCSDVKNFTDKYIDDNYITEDKKDKFTKCSSFTKLIDTIDYNRYTEKTNSSINTYIPINTDANGGGNGGLVNTNNNLFNLNIDFLNIMNDSNVNNSNIYNVFKYQIYIYILITIIINIYLSLFIIPIIFSGGILITLFIILLSIIILSLILKLFS